MKLQTLKNLKSGFTTNIKIKSAVEVIIQNYKVNLPDDYSHEDIINVVFEECFNDAKNKSDDMLGFRLNPSNLPYLISLMESKLNPMDSLFGIDLTSETKIKKDL